MNRRLPPFHEPGLHWVGCLSRAVDRIELPKRTCYGSIVNAIEVQIEEGMDAETVRHLLRALLRFAAVDGLTASDLGLLDDVDAIVDSITQNREGPR